MAGRLSGCAAAISLAHCRYRFVLGLFLKRSLEKWTMT